MKNTKIFFALTALFLIATATSPTTASQRGVGIEMHQGKICSAGQTAGDSDEGIICECVSQIPLAEGLGLWQCRSVPNGGPVMSPTVPSLTSRFSFANSDIL